MSKIKELSKRLFDQYPVLAWTDDEEGYVPKAEHSPLPSDCGPLLVKARLFPKNGPSLDGYVIGLESVYAIGIFGESTDYVFNSRVFSMKNKIETELFKALKTEPFELFPLRFTTEFSLLNGTALEGWFNIDS
jgi:hypothetical protein